MKDFSRYEVRGTRCEGSLHALSYIRMAFLTVVMMAALLPLHAQEEEGGESKMMQVQGNIVYENERGKKQSGGELYYNLMSTKQANEAYKAFLDAFQIKDLGIKATTIDNLRDKYEVTAMTTALTFKENAMPNMAFVFVNDEAEKVLLVPIEKGKTKYKDLKIIVNTVDETIVTGKAAEQDIIDVEPEDTDDGWVTFNINLKLSSDFSRDDARLIIQPYAVDCQTEDTLDYVSPIVIEGEKYHRLQNKRMAYNYDKNDKLASAYVGTQQLELGKPVIVKKSVKWKKPDHLRSHNFNSPIFYSFEDYHHVYKEDSKEGSCLISRPFKFLDFSDALADLPLTDEFYEKARSQIQEKAQKLDLKFVRGRSELTNDSSNNVKRDALVKELRSYGSTLISVSISGAASPEGSLARNEQLARERAVKARQLIAPYISGVSIETGAPKVFSWSDVAEKLREKGKEDIATQVQEIIDGGGDSNSQGSRIMGLPVYKTDIESVLEEMRIMTVSFMYNRKYIMNKQECKDEYFKYKKEYLNGEKHFSNGDYYNLFSVIKDSLELDTLTMMAYKEITSDIDYQLYNIISPYVCNRMAMMQMKRGTPNTDILKPFIDFRRRGKGTPPPTSIDYEIRPKGRFTTHFNRRQIMVNQAVCYYMDAKPDTAKFLVQWLKGAQKGDSNVVKLEKFINLRQLHPRRKSLVGQERSDYNAAKELALEKDENKAILYTEIEDWGKRGEAMKWVNMLPDDSPKKWYLKGILWAAQAAAGNNPPYVKASAPKKGGKGEEEFYELDAEELGLLRFDDPDRYEKYLKWVADWQENHPDEPLPQKKVEAPTPKPAAEGNTAAVVDVTKTEIPRYLVYFHHSFLLEPSYKKFYACERNVGEDLRKKYKYKKADRPAYEQLFELIRYEDDNAMMGGSSDSESSENAEAPENPEASENAEPTGKAEASETPSAPSNPE